MKHLAIIAALVVLVVAPATSVGGSTSPTPIVLSTACTWRTQGQVVTEPDGSRHQCHCDYVEAIDEYWCVWLAVDPVKASRYRLRHKLRAVRYYGHPRIGAWLS